MKKRIIFILFSSLLIFSSCLKKDKNENNSSLSPELKDQITKSVEQFKNRKIYTKLTEEIIDSLTDDELLQVVFDNLSKKLPKDYSEEYKYITESFNSSQQAIYLSWWLEGEVNNGGFNQYYTNSSGQYAEILPELLAKMEAKKFADLAERANETYKTELKTITKEQDGTLEGFSQSYENNPLNKYDEEFYKLYDVENLYKKQIDFIRKNKKDFIN
ncbi:DMP19 family protein [Aquimarina litoralis]|uniref:DMP19 family protein n=1 Tax=Aquimarina litoralis TaxID=584605 RepID=UPI001C57C29B|nr:DUF4375 domain-containing protein [Aquimarina litoralis]MBW1296367.1 DUF4375 domain-containing protein [Aquimarina litoralis]